MKLRTKQRVDFWIGGSLLLILQVVTPIMGWLTRRDHDRKLRSDLLFIKMQGGGSLVIALPALLGLKRKHPDVKFRLLTTPAVSPFARTLGVFNEIIEVGDRSVLQMVSTSLKAWSRTLGTDTVIDLEVYSLLTGVFSLMTMARNRIGFYLESASWRRNVFTHLIYFNRYAGTYLFYEDVARHLEAEPANQESCIEALRQTNGLSMFERTAAEKSRIAIGHACSELGEERMLTALQWRDVLRSSLAASCEIIFLGVERDRALADRIIQEILSIGQEGWSFRNECGRFSLTESVQVLASCDEFYGVDSSLLHYARVLGLRCHSYWGPTDPATRLKRYPRTQDLVHYSRVSCSPCVHVAEVPPCFGNNVCIKNLTGEPGANRSLNSFLIPPLKPVPLKKMIQVSAAAGAFVVLVCWFLLGGGRISKLSSFGGERGIARVNSGNKPPPSSTNEQEVH